MKDCTCPEPRATSWSLSCELHGQSRIRTLEARVEMVYKAREADAAHIKGLSEEVAELRGEVARSPARRRTPRRSR